MWFDLMIVPFALPSTFESVTGTIPNCALSTVLLETVTPAEA